MQYAKNISIDLNQSSFRIRSASPSNTSNCPLSIAHQSPPRIKSTKTTDNGTRRYSISIGFLKYWAHKATLLIAGDGYDGSYLASASRNAPGLASRKEFKTTNVELSAIPIPLAQGGNQPIIASGIQIKL